MTEDKSEVTNQNPMEAFGHRFCNRPDGRPYGGQILARMSTLMSELQCIKKTEKNSFHNYKFRSHEQALLQLQPLLVKHGIVTEPQILKEEIQTGLADKKGKPLILARIVYQITWVCADDGSYMQSIGYGHGIDDQDKAAYKALSGAIKYIIFHTFMIPTDERVDPEFDNTEPVDESAVQDASKSVKKLKTQAEVEAFMADVVNVLGEREFEKVRLIAGEHYESLSE